MPWLQLIRWKNLAIIFFTQFLAWYCVILPCTPLYLDWVNFLLLSLSTLLIAASGYIINDYFDLKIDAINRPHKMVLGKSIAPKTAIIIHFVLNIIALLLAGFVAVIEHCLLLPLLQLGCTVLLWFYSTHYKRAYMIGNIVVSLLTALTIITLVLYEPVMLNIAHLPYFNTTHQHSSLPFWVLLLYAYFAFMLNWMREIVKDMEDFVGDANEGCQTLPIKKGIKFASRFTIALAFFVIIPLSIACGCLFYLHYLLFACYVFFALVVPIVAWCVFFITDLGTLHFNKASRLLKIIMLLGVASLIIYFFQTYT